MSDLEKVKKDWTALQYVRNQTDSICLAAVKQNGCSLVHVQNQTEAICMEAVKIDGYALEYVQHQTEAICLEATKEDYHALRYVQPCYFKASVKNLRVRALFDQELDSYINHFEKKTQKRKMEIG